MSIVVLGGVGLYCFNPSQYWFAPKCLFKLITGLSCPGCGLQRAVYALMHGDVMEAARCNFYLLYSGPYLASFVFVWVMPESRIRERISNFINNRYVVDFYLVTFVLWFVIRNIYDL